MASLVSKIARPFGSDVYTRYTAVYTWNSNQMAYAMMGFAGTTLFIHAPRALAWNSGTVHSFTCFPF